MKTLAKVLCLCTEEHATEITHASSFRGDLNKSLKLCLHFQRQQSLQPKVRDELKHFSSELLSTAISYCMSTIDFLPKEF